MAVDFPSLIGDTRPTGFIRPEFVTARCENIEPTFASPVLCIAGFRPQAWLMLSSPSQLEASTAILTIAEEGIDYLSSRNI